MCEYLRHASVHVFSSWTIDDGALLGILRIVRNVVGHEHYDVLVPKPILLQQLICVANVGLQETINIC